MDGRTHRLSAETAGKAAELTDALIVNPYDADEVATAIRDALEMSPEELRERMQRLRAVVRERTFIAGQEAEIHDPASVCLAPGCTSFGRATTGTKVTIVMDIARARTAGFRPNDVRELK